MLQKYSGTVFNGRWYDSVGDVYSTRWSDRKFVDANSRFISAAESDTNNEFEQLSRKFEKEGYIQTSSYEEAEYLYNYYTAIYTLYNCNVQPAIKNSNVTVLTHNFPKEVNKEYIKQEILLKFGMPTGETEYEVLWDACQRVSMLDYDHDYLRVDLLTAINNNSGVCWQYAKVLDVLLEAAGLESECVIGVVESSLGNEGHMWNRTRIDGKWVYTDPLLFDTKWVGYYNIDYETYVTCYTSGLPFVN